MNSRSSRECYLIGNFCGDFPVEVKGSFTAVGDANPRPNTDIQEPSEPMSCLLEQLSCNTPMLSLDLH